MRGITITALLGAATAITTTTKENKPVSKVIGLLDTMKNQLDAERADDEAVYKKLMCWIDDNTEKSQKIIAETDGNTKRLAAFIEKGSAQIEELKAAKEQLKSEMDAKVDQRDEARAHALEQTEGLRADQAEFKKNVKTLDSALVALGAGKAFNQQEIMAIITTTEARHPDITSHAKGLLASMLQTSADHFDSYANQGGAIVGVLTQMRDQMTADLAECEQDLQTAQNGADNVIAKLTEAIAADKAEYESKVQKHGQVETGVANAKVELNGAEEKLKAAQEFLAQVEEKKRVTQEDYEKRTKARAEEVAAITDTVGILNNDEAFAARQDTYNNFFLQLRSVRKTVSPRDRAANLLSRAGMSFLATAVKDGEFEEVFKAFDELKAELETKQKTEEQDRDACVADQAENKANLAGNQHDQDTTTAGLNKATADMEKSAQEVEEVNAEVQDTEQSLQAASNDKNSENIVYRKEQQENSATLSVLNKAIGRLAKTYEATALVQKKPQEIRFIQIRAHDDDEIGSAPPAGFKSYDTKEVGSGPLALLRKLADELKGSVQDARESEQDSTSEYEKLMKTSNSQVSALIQSRDAALETGATAKSRKAELEGDMSTLKDQLNGFLQVHDALHEECNELLRNFDARQSARRQEMDAITEAKSILSGKGVFEESDDDDDE